MSQPLSPFRYRKPNDEQVDTMETLSQKLEDVYEYIKVAIPSSAERTIGIRSLQEARMWFNAALVLSARVETT